MLRIPLPPPTNPDPSPPISEAELTVLLPASYTSTDGQRRSPRENIGDFLKRELDVGRLNAVHQYLWLAGRPRPARALHQQLTLGRHITLAEQADLHLLWAGDNIYIKPLPRFLLHFQFWAENIVRNTELYPQALGFLISYVWLIVHESDLCIAKDEMLLPADMSWEEWVRTVDAILAESDSTFINKRYHHGELRLPRINVIYRFMPGVKGRSLVNGYRNDYTEYGTFFRRNFTYIVIVFALITTVLSAIQVGLGTDRLREDDGFQKASLVAAVFAMVITGAVLVGGFTIFSGLFMYHSLKTLILRRGESLTLRNGLEGGVAGGLE